VKFADGGWFPLLLAAGVFILLSTWKRGRLLLISIQRESALPLELLIKDFEKRPIARVPGTAVFMTSDVTGVPPVMLHHLKHNKVLHERVLVMSVSTEEVPSVPDDQRIDLRDLPQGFHVVTAHYGFMESPDVPRLLHLLSERGLQIRVAETSFYLGRETILPTGNSHFALWRKRLFILLSRNAQSAAAFFNLPPNRVVELGAQIQL
jgi:KUP system potassium uptake protein